MSEHIVDTAVERPVRVRQTGLQIALASVESHKRRIEELNQLLEEQRARTEHFERQLANQKQEHEQYVAERAEAHMTELAEEKKQHGYTKSNKDSYYKQFNEATVELDALHDVLDRLNNTPVRIYKDANNYDVKRSLLTRFAIWQASSLAQR